MDLPVMPPIKPMLAKALEELPDGELALEPKWDGFRCIVFKDGDEIVLGSRNQKPFNRYFPDIFEPLRASLPDRCVVDGELIDQTFVDSLHAFLGWLPAASRPRWEQVLVDRSALIAAADGLPKTLLHGDTDDRNIGLSVGAEDADSRLTLIDWEWICIGPGGLDAAKPIHQLPASFLGEPEQIATYIDLLPDWGLAYARAYRRHGGKASEAEMITGYQIGLVREAMSPFPRVIGGVLLAKQGQGVSLDSVAVMELPEALYDVVLDWGEQMVNHVSDYLRMFMD